MVTDNIGNSRSYGVEAQTWWQATKSLTFNGSAGYLNSRWKQAAAFGVSVDGNTIPNAPEFTASLRGDYSRRVAQDLLFDFSVDASYTSKFWWDLFNTPGSQEPSNWFVTPRIAIGSSSGSWTLSFRVSNALGKEFWTEYYPNIFQPPYPCGGCANLGAIGAPREYRLNLTLKH